MVWLVKWVNFLVYSNLWIALGAVAFTCQFYLFYHLPIDWVVLFFNFFGTIFIYTFQRILKIKQGQAPGVRLNWMKDNYFLVMVLTFLSAIGVVGCLGWLNYWVYPLLIINGLIAFLYSIKFLKGKTKNLRDLPGLKIILVAFVWSSTTLLLPFYNSNYGLVEFPLALFLTYFSFYFALAIPFDIRDLMFDEKSTKTIPQLLNKKGAILLAIGLWIIYGLAINLISTNYLVVNNVGLLLGGVLIVFSLKKTENDLYYSMVLDGLLVILPILFYIDSL